MVHGELYKFKKLRQFSPASRKLTVGGAGGGAGTGAGAANTGVVCSILRPAEAAAAAGVAGAAVGAAFKPLGKNRPLPPEPPPVTIAST